MSNVSGMVPKDAINTGKIIEELQSSFDNERYSFRDVAFSDSADHAVELAVWRDELADSWKQLVLHTMETWDFAWHHTYDHPCPIRAEWLFRRKESPFKNCIVEDCRQVIRDTLVTKPREPEQFLLFMLAALTQGATLWSYAECKNEADMQKPKG